MSKKLSMLVAICLSVSACNKLPPFPTVEIRLVDASHGKIHRYHLPKKRGESAPYLGSIPLTTAALHKNYTIAPREYAKLEQYISTVEDYAEENCK